MVQSYAYFWLFLILWKLGSQYCISSNKEEFIMKAEALYLQSGIGITFPQIKLFIESFHC